MKGLVLAITIAIIMMTTNVMMTVKADCPFHSQGCSYNKMMDVVKDMDKLFDDFMKSPKVDMEAFGQNMSALGQKLETEQGGCVRMVGMDFKESDFAFKPSKGVNASFINNTIVETVTLTTSACLENNKTSKAYMEDPCCNRQLQDKQCCMEKPKTGKRFKINKFNPVVRSCCKDGAKLERALRSLNKKLFSTMIQSQEQQSGSFLRGINTQSGAIFRCLFQTLGNQIPCATDADCPGKCSLMNHMCEVVAPTFAVYSAGMNKCLQNALPGPLYNQLVATLFKKVEQGRDLGGELLKSFKQPNCVNKFNPDNVIDNSGKNMTECQKMTRCSDGGANCIGTAGFCGYGCKNETVTGEVKTRCQGVANLNEAACSNKVLCHPFNTYLPKAECEAKTFCNHPANYSANAAQCASLFICVGYPYGPKCMIDTKNCPTGYEKRDNMNGLCVDSFANDDETKCLQKTNATWVLPPQTAQDCLKYKTCLSSTNQPMGSMSHEECMKCGSAGFILKPSFRAVPAKFQNAKAGPEVYWAPSKGVVKVGQFNQNGVSVDFSKIGGLLLNMISRLVKPMFKIAYSTQMNSIFSVLKTVSCACGTDRANTKRCFAPPKFPAGGVACLPGVAETYKDKVSKVTLKTNPASCGEAQSGEALTIFEHEVLDTSAARSLMEDKIKIAAKRDDKEVCSVMGDGYNVEPAPSGGVTLCVPVDTDKFAVVSDKHTVPSVVSASSEGAYTFKTSDVAVEDGTHCFTVSDTMTYHAAYCEKVEEKKDDSPASTTTFSIALVVIMSIVAYFV